MKPISYTARAFVGAFAYVIGFGLLYIVGGLVLSIVPIYIWLWLGLPG